MGYGHYSDTDYSARTASRTLRGVSAFEHTEAVEQGRAAAGVHDLMRPTGVIRESRDSADHPESTAIGVFFDVTGSMHTVPRIFQQRMSNLMNLLLRRLYVPGPQVLVGAIGDATSRDRAPLQVGQFESDIKVDDHLSRIYLERGGGGGMHESYELAAYFAARRTAIDCMEKRNKRGYLFMLGDEMAYEEVSADQVRSLMGPEAGFQGELSTTDLFIELRRKFDVYFIVPYGTSNYNAPILRTHWTQNVGADHLMYLTDPEAVCELIASTIGFAEGHTLAELEEHLNEQGSNASITAAVMEALKPLAVDGVHPNPARNIIRA